MKIKTKDNFELDVEYHKIENAKGVIVFAHGMTVDKNDEGIFVRGANELHHRGFSTIRFDFRAHGKSQGNSVTDFTITNELVDLETMIDFAKSEKYEYIYLAGASFGGGVSAVFAGQHPNVICKLFLANPIMNYEKRFFTPEEPWTKKYFQNIFARLDAEGLIEVGSQKFKLGRTLFEEMPLYRPYEVLKAYMNPLLVVHGDQDSKVDFQSTYEDFQQLPSTNKQFVKIAGSDHGFHEEPFETEVTSLLVKFFEE